MGESLSPVGIWRRTEPYMIPAAYLSNGSLAKEPVHVTVVHHDRLLRGPKFNVQRSADGNIIVRSRRIRLHPVAHLFDRQLLTQTSRCMSTWVFPIFSVSTVSANIDYYSRLFICGDPLNYVLAMNPSRPVSNVVR